MVLARVRIGRQLGTLARLEDSKNNGADEGADELWDRLVDVVDAKVDTGQLTRGAARHGRVGAVLQVE